MPKNLIRTETTAFHLNAKCLPGSRAIALCVIALCTTVPPSFAADGDPIAIRQWPDGSVSVENHWGLSIMVRDDSAAPQDRRSEETSSQSAPQQVVSAESKVDHVLSRMVNQSSVRWQAAEGNLADENAIRARSILDTGGRAVAMRIQADGVAIAILSEQINGSGAIASSDASPIDVVVVPAGLKLPLPDQASEWIQSNQPRFVLMPSTVSEAAGDGFARSIGASGTIRSIDHNTFAVTKTGDRQPTPQLVRWAVTTWEMPQDLESLFTAMEDSCERSQQVFAKLSANQLNFRPANGTHTPRWNAEHMMGRQLGFFSQIYHAIDPTIPEMDLNPKQMPTDYSAAHSDWNGLEEAMQMQRVSEFTRRFAYLLDGVDLDGKAPGSRWTLRALLRQMDRHYEQHTANTVKKFDLPEWPAE